MFDLPVNQAAPEPSVHEATVERDALPDQIVPVAVKVPGSLPLPVKRSSPSKPKNTPYPTTNALA